MLSRRGPRGGGGAGRAAAAAAAGAVVLGLVALLGLAPVPPGGGLLPGVGAESLLNRTFYNATTGKNESATKYPFYKETHTSVFLASHRWARCATKVVFPSRVMFDHTLKNCTGADKELVQTGKKKGEPTIYKVHWNTGPQMADGSRKKGVGYPCIQEQGVMMTVSEVTDLKLGVAYPDYVESERVRRDSFKACPETTEFWYYKNLTIRQNFRGHVDDDEVIRYIWNQKSKRKRIVQGQNETAVMDMPVSKWRNKKTNDTEVISIDIPKYTFMDPSERKTDEAEELIRFEYEFMDSYMWWPSLANQFFAAGIAKAIRRSTAGLPGRPFPDGNPYGRPVRFLHMGCGSGFMGVIQAAMNPNVTVYFSDQDPAVMHAVKKNVAMNYVEDQTSFHVGEWFDAFKGIKDPKTRGRLKFDHIFLNPPQMSYQMYTGEIKANDGEDYIKNTYEGNHTWNFTPTGRDHYIYWGFLAHQYSKHLEAGGSLWAQVAFHLVDEVKGHLLSRARKKMQGRLRVKIWQLSPDEYWNDVMLQVTYVPRTF